MNANPEQNQSVSKYNLAVDVFDERGYLVSTALTRSELARIVEVPIHSRNEKGNWNVEDPDAPDSLSGVDEVSISMRTKFHLRCRLVSVDA